MALDSPELMNYLAELAKEVEAERIILRPTATKAWEYEQDGTLAKSDISPLQTSQQGRRLICTPSEPKEDGFWNCTLFDEDDNVLREIIEQFPE